MATVTKVKDILDNGKYKRNASPRLVEESGQLLLWDRHRRYLPNEFVRSALFSSASKKKPRKEFRNESIYCYGNAEIRFSGEELRSYDDELIWLQLCYLFSQARAQERISVQLSDIIHGIKGCGSGKQYKAIKAAIDRLDRAKLRIKTKRRLQYEEHSFCMIRKFKQTGEGRDARWEIYLEPEVIELYKGVFYTYVDWDLWIDLSPSQRRLAGWIRSHREPTPIDMNSLRLLLSSDTEKDFTFKQFINRSLQGLMAKSNIVESYEWVGASKKELSVVRGDVTPKASLPI